MCSVFLQIGQGGNQIGQSFFDAVGISDGSNKCSSSSISSCIFQHRDQKLRSVNVDSEWKTANSLKKNQLIRADNIIHGVCGRGNNWAMGYYGLNNPHEKDILEKTLRSVRKESERCDTFTGIVVFHSLTGGTGAGFGSLVVEHLRELYSSSSILSCAIAPYASGETPLQHYNSMLSLSWLHRFVDGILMLPNDAFHQTLVQENGKRTNRMKLSIWDINRAMSQALAGVLYPTDTLLFKKEYNLGDEPWYLLKTLCSRPGTKIVSLSHRQFRHSWEQTLTSLTRSFIGVDNKFKSISNILVGRSENQSNCFIQAVQKRQEQIQNNLNCVSWNRSPVDCWTADHCLPGEKVSSLTLASNTGFITDFLENSLQKAKTMYENKAYLHWYWRHGASQNDFEKAFETAQGIIENYEAVGT